jgi:hypothetical protein
LKSANGTSWNPIVLDDEPYEISSGPESGSENEDDNNDMLNADMFSGQDGDVGQGNRITLVAALFTTADPDVGVRAVGGNNEGGGAPGESGENDGVEECSLEGTQAPGEEEDQEDDGDGVTEEEQRRRRDKRQYIPPVCLLLMF